MPTPTKTTHLQIRVSPAEKAAIVRAAAAAGLDMSTWVLSRVLDPLAGRFGEWVAECTDDEAGRSGLAGLNDFLAGLSARELAAAVGTAPPARLGGQRLNYVAAMVELACGRAGVPAPAWCAAIPPLREPWFASDLGSLRLHLLHASPAPFRRRNLFIDASVGDRV